MGGGSVHPYVERLPLFLLLGLSIIGTIRYFYAKDDIYTFHFIEDAKKTGAVCLDGSPGGFHYFKSPRVDDSKKYMLAFQGGGWCSDEKSCAERATNSAAGSTAFDPKAIEDQSFTGMLSHDCEINPTFCHWNKILFYYCDGNSFSGDRADPITTDHPRKEGEKVDLYFRGDRIVEQTLKQLSKDFGFNDAHEIVVTGNSAGGLASVTQTNRIHDYVKAKVSHLHKFKTIVASGVFANTPSVEGEETYLTRMTDIAKMAQPTYGYPNEFSSRNAHPCIESHPNEPHLCQFVENHIVSLTTPVFFVNSVVDRWTALCHMSARFKDGSSDVHCNAMEELRDCVGTMDKCTQDQFTKLYLRMKESVLKALGVEEVELKKSESASARLMNAIQNIDKNTTVQVYDNILLEALRLIRDPSNASNKIETTVNTAIATVASEKKDISFVADGRLSQDSGYFLHTCSIHGEAWKVPEYGNIKINDITMNQAIVKWYIGGENKDAPLHRYNPCDFKTEAPYQCNDTCPALA